MIDKLTAILSLHPNAEATLYNGEDIIWHSSDISQPTEQEIQAEIQRLQAEHEATQYQRDRATAYPAIGDQLDALFHAGVFPPEMAEKLQAVKDKYPKGASV